ncbi:hypothetical protein [Enterococcus rivorum]|uniref:3-dehydroquinate synthase domain-containing protein n=1 Tax=Enterococcus rivorum TaxID=762845 RepID=A0A1E5KXX3_9ENTE|nr:hypothetical protein [Enterococcus rivorum]MBP2099680.1 hypothetical protein [Enterococcus rivorum]OEH82706.1 hypothetical protein BCR26_12280 [Enterococcus rivorum]
MELAYEKSDQKTLITYGETFAAQLRKESLSSKHIVLLTNQRYYDLFSDKLIQLFEGMLSIDWYICRNDSHCNNFEELQEVLAFLSELNQQHSFIFLGVGNEGVVQLANFIKKNCLFKAVCWLLPLSIQSLSQSLLVQSVIELNNKAVLGSKELPERIIYDHTLLNDRGDSKLIDFLVFIKCGLVCSHDFLRMLYLNYNEANHLKHTSFNGMLKELIHYYEIQGEEINRFGQLFEEAFLETENGHLLSSHMKRLLGCLLQLLWSQEVSQFDFHYKNFLVWLIHLGYPIDFPKQILVSDYVESVTNQMNQWHKALLLDDIGVINDYQEPDVNQLLMVVEKYKEIIEEIRG